MMPTFTGVSDPYEPPADADIVVDTTRRTSGEAAESILERLRSEGYLREGGNRSH
jgi:sulfate adenylyltransferase